MNFRDFVRDKSLNEMAMNLRDAKAAAFTQLDSTVDHLLKTYIGQDLISTEVGKDWEIQIDNFLNRITRIKLKSNKKNLSFNLLKDELAKVIRDCKEDSRILSLTKEIESGNYDGTILKTPENEKLLLDHIQVFLLDICKDIENGDNSFKRKFPSFLEKLSGF